MFRPFLINRILAASTSDQAQLELQKIRISTDQGLAAASKLWKKAYAIRETDPDRALAFYQGIIEIGKDMNYAYIEGIGWYETGQLSLNSGREDGLKALISAEKLISGGAQQRHVDTLIEVYRTLVSVLVDDQEYSSAIAYAKRARYLFARLGDPDKSEWAEKLLANLQSMSSVAPTPVPQQPKPTGALHRGPDPSDSIRNTLRARDREIAQLRQTIKKLTDDVERLQKEKDGLEVRSLQASALASATPAIHPDTLRARDQEIAQLREQVKQLSDNVERLEKDNTALRSLQASALASNASATHPKDTRALWA